MEENTPTPHLTEDQIDHIAEKAAQKALDKVYSDVGRSVLHKLAWFAGIVVVSLMMFLAGKDAIHLN